MSGGQVFTPGRPHPSFCRASRASQPAPSPWALLSSWLDCRARPGPPPSQAHPDTFNVPRFTARATPRPRTACRTTLRLHTAHRTTSIVLPAQALVPETLARDLQSALFRSPPSDYFQVRLRLWTTTNQTGVTLGTDRDLSQTSQTPPTQHLTDRKQRYFSETGL